MRHAPYSTFSDATPVRAATARRTPTWTDGVFALLAATIRLPRRMAAIRRDMALLGAMTTHELADIGLSRQDVCDAAALPLGRSPGALLRGRADERRGAGPSVRR